MIWLLGLCYMLDIDWIIRHTMEYTQVLRDLRDKYVCVSMYVL
jgi:hypothetical protein